MGKEMSKFNWEEVFPYHSEYFPHAENLELLFCSNAFVDKIVRGNII